ncbi:MAG TPA: SusD/RagB family nutrient-binding outer membrane lipoprotein [Flavisolibacter sp.]|nr:SusD/RagB family nutrient-binding outer membrane lipoprotein [Flavisolibacter sp.]
MKKILISSIFVISLVGCTKDLTSLNEETKKAAIAPASTLFSNAVRNLTDVLTSPNVNTNVFRFTVQHWAATTYQDEPNYDFSTRNIPQSWWTTMYRDVLADLQESKRLINTDITITEGTKKNQTAITDIMQVYTYTVLVNTFGDVPYTEALDYNKLFPKYDDAKTIYDDLLLRLNSDIANLDKNEVGFSSDQDLVYSGSVSGWIKFANSLKMKLAMTVADVDPAKAKTAVEQADAGAFLSASDNALFKYYATTPNNNPIWNDLVQSKRQDYVIANTLVNKMQPLNDPRIQLFFKPNDAGQYEGGTVGSNNTFTAYAKPTDKITAMDYPALLLSYDEIEFYRAEAVERGMNVGGSAETHYNNAIAANITYWGGTGAQADAFLARPDVAYSTASGDWKQKIGLQKWIALFNRGFEGWTEYRRLDAPALPAPAAAKSGFPNRFTYPSNEQTLNNANYSAAASKIGGDKVETKIFWDKL